MIYKIDQTEISPYKSIYSDDEADKIYKAGGKVIPLHIFPMIFRCPWCKQEQDVTGENKRDVISDMIERNSVHGVFLSDSHYEGIETATVKCKKCGKKSTIKPHIQIELSPEKEYE